MIGSRREARVKGPATANRPPLQVSEQLDGVKLLQEGAKTYGSIRGDGDVDGGNDRRVDRKRAQAESAIASVRFFLSKLTPRSE